MVFNIGPVALTVVVFFLFLWLSGVTYLLLRALANYNRLTQGVSEKTLSEILNNFLQEDKLTREEVVKVLSEIKKIRDQSKRFIQKVGLIRFNPFSDTGGDQSFSLALLDGNDNGIIITSLYARTGIRWYRKTVKNGKGQEHELSSEEKEALKKAKKAT